MRSKGEGLVTYVHRGYRHRISITLVRVFVLVGTPVLLSPLSVGQTTPLQGVVLFRHVRVLDKGNVAVDATVLVSNGKMTRVDPGLPAPPGATVIDAGGSVLTIAPDGTIKLSSATGTSV